MTLLTSPANPRVKQLRAAFRNQSRLAAGLVAIEGETLIQEAIRSGLPLKTIFLSESTPLPPWLPRSVELLHLPDDLFQSAVDTHSPKGIAALLVPPVWSRDILTRDLPANPLFLIAAGVQDPGNLGTLIRSAEAFAATAVLTTPGTVAPWNQKCLRASAGSLFRVPMFAIEPGAPGLAFETWVSSHKIHLFAAVASSPSAKSAASANLTQPCAILIGNEGAGLSAELLALADTHITLPTPGPVESLNAAIAGSLLLYEAARQRLASSSRLNSSHLIARET